jgi:hypothetical protein
LLVMAGLDPAIHRWSKAVALLMDGRVKPGHDETQGLYSWQSGLTDASPSSPARAMVWDGRMR